MKSRLDKMGLMLFLLLLGNGAIFAFGIILQRPVLVDIAIIILGILLQIILVFLFNLAPDNRHMFASERQYKFARFFNRIIFYGFVSVILMEQFHSLVHIVKSFLK